MKTLNNYSNGYPKSSKFILSIVLFTNFLQGFGMNMVSIGLPNHILVLGGTLASYGFILGIYQIFQAIFQLPTSLFSDKLGRRKIILIGMLVYIIGTILCGLATTIPQMIFFRIIQGMGAFSSVLMSVIGDIATGEAKKRAISYYFFSLTSGFLFGTIFGGIFTDFFGVEGTFFICAGLTFISFLLTLIFLPETAPIEMKVQLNTEKKNAPKISNSQLSWRNKMRFIRLKGFYGGIFAIVLATSIMGGAYAYTTWVLSIFYKMSNFNLSLVLGLLTITYAIGILSAPKLSQRVGEVNLISLGFILNIVLFVLIIFIPGLGTYVTATCIAYFIFGFLITTITNFTLNFVPTPSRGLGTGIFHTFLFLASALGQIFLLKISDLTNFRATYSILAGLCLLAWVIIEILKRDKK